MKCVVTGLETKNKCHNIPMTTNAIMNAGEIMGEIRQPKFKMGDKLVSDDGVFVVDSIRWCSDGSQKDFHYEGFKVDARGYDRINYPGRLLKLYQEPQKRKLYAYTSERGDTSNVEFKMKDGTYYNLERCPEYDIEYPGGEMSEQNGR